MTRNTTIIALTTVALSSMTSADIVGVGQYGRYINAIDGFGAPDFSGYVVDLVLISDDPTDTVLNVFDLQMTNSLGDVSYYQSMTGNTWLPNNMGGQFETDALRHADSFISIGGRDSMGSPSYENGLVVQMDPNGSNVDPNFGGVFADQPGPFAGWYNSNPTNYIGQPVEINGRLEVFIGRFAINGASAFTLDGIISIGWNNAIGTPLESAYNVPIPAPGALAVLGIAGLTGNRRRRA